MTVVFCQHLSFKGLIGKIGNILFLSCKHLQDFRPVKKIKWISELWVCVCILLLDAGSHWMPRFCARLWDRDPAIAKLLPYWENRKQKKREVIFLHMHPGRFVTLSPSPRWLRLHGWENTCLRNMPHCFSGSERWHFYKTERRCKQEMRSMWKRSAADESERQTVVKVQSARRLLIWMQLSAGGWHTGSVQCRKRTLQRKKRVAYFLFIKWTQSKHFGPLLFAGWLYLFFLKKGQWMQNSNR